MNAQAGPVTIPATADVARALRDACAPGVLAPGWRPVIHRLASRAERLAGATLAADLLRCQLQGHAERQVDTLGPGALGAVLDVANYAEDQLRDAVHRYAWRAIATLGILTVGGAANPGSWHLPGEDLAEAERVPDAEPSLPGWLAELRLPLLALAERQLLGVEMAEAERRDAFEVTDEETGLLRDYVPEHRMAEAAELEAEAARWQDYVGQWADAVAWTLVHDLRDRLAAA